MESFAPEFAHYWLTGQGANVGETRDDRRDDDANAQQAALEALADRVTAARSVFWLFAQSDGDRRLDRRMRLVPDKREILEFVPGDRRGLAPDIESRKGQRLSR